MSGTDSEVELLNLPMRGTDSEVDGTSSAMSSMNMEKARNTDSPKLIFSPDISEKRS